MTSFFMHFFSSFFNDTSSAQIQYLYKNQFKTVTVRIKGDSSLYPLFMTFCQQVTGKGEMNPSYLLDVALSCEGVTLLGLSSSHFLQQLGEDGGGLT